MTLRSERSEIRRLPARGHYDRETVYAILDRHFLCHIAWIADGKPRIIPTAYGRAGDSLYVHGSVKSSLLRHLAKGVEAAIAVSQIDAVVLARSLFHSSMNYQSVIVYGTGKEVTDPDEKMEGLRIVSDSIWPGRWQEARLPDVGELGATMVVKIDITDGAAKIRTGPPKDNADDYNLNIWAGLVPSQTSFLDPVADDHLRPDIPLPESLRRNRKLKDHKQ